MYWRISVLFLIFTASFSVSLAQSYEVDCSRMPLNELLVLLRGQYDLQLSFDDGLLSTYTITLKGNYPSSEALIEALLKKTSLDFEKVNGVFVIYPLEANVKPMEFLLSGQLFEAGSGEPLPFSHVLIDDYATVSDLKGSFSYASSDDSSFRVRASHLGCYILDTILYAGSTHRLYLQPFSYDIREVVVRDNRVERSVQMGEGAGLIKLNSYIAQYVPGNGDNSVFNLLRLQPGILAAGEQPNDLIIQGSPEGTSRVLFDGITIWGLKNFSDNISAVNPFLAKSIQIYKSGYDALRSDLVGGMVDITGKVGNIQKPEYNLFVNNQTINGMLELPVSSQSSLILALRQTYYNLLDKEDFPLLSSGNFDYQVDVTPAYVFHDINAKYSLQGNNGDLFFVSLFGAEDRFSYEVSQNREYNVLSQTKREANIQSGASVFYGKNWKGGDRTQLSATYSLLQSEYGMVRNFNNKRFNRAFITLNESTDTDLSELQFRLSNHSQMGNRHNLDVGFQAVFDEVALREDTFEVESSNLRSIGKRLTLFMQDDISLWRGGYFKPGIRMNFLPNPGITLLDPRLEWRQRLGRVLKINASWGQYHQFLVKSSLVDDNGNYRYTWSLANNETVPILSSRHWVAGATLAFPTLTLSVEGYHKSTSGMTRYVRSFGKKEAIFIGEGRSYGIDLFVKKDFNAHSLWASYSLGRAEELFPYFPEKAFRRAPQDQRHEFKLTGLVNAGAFHLSGAWVYGSGFPLYKSYLSRTYSEPDYRRLDLSLVYRMRLNKINGEAGLSVMNVLDADNVKYSSFERVPLDQLNTVYINTDSMPFTPLLFLKLNF